MVTTKFPINGAIATGTVGGLFPLMLKNSGYDHVVISGRSDRPVYLKIYDDDVELCDATDLWGKADVWQTVDLLRRKYEPCSVLPIGPSGENLVKFSMTMLDKTGHLGSGGLPSVMGSKNLKAIVAVQGTKGIRVADRAGLLRTADHLAHQMKEWRGREGFVRSGHLQAPDDTELVMIAPTSVSYADMTPLDQEVKNEVVRIHAQLRKPVACASCPTSCRDRVRLIDGEYANKLVYAASISPQRVGTDTAKDIYYRSVYITEMVNRYGLCNQHFRDVISVSTELYNCASS